MRRIITNFFLSIICFAIGVSAVFMWNAAFLSGDAIPSVSYLQDMQPLSPDEAIKFKYGIRQVDFENFTYPVMGHWNWITKQVTLTNTKSALYFSGKDSLQVDGYALKVKYEDLTGDGAEEATVVLDALYSYGTGGAIRMTWTYIYTMNGEQPLLLKYSEDVEHFYCA